MANRSRCPSCGERVSPYAAGCAVCGADLDPARWDTGPSALQRMGSALSAVTFGGLSPVATWLLIGALVVILGTPLLAWLGVL